MKAYRVRERLDPARSPLPWLQRVTINLCYSRVSRRKSLSEPITSLITNLVVDLATRPDQVAESREVLEVLQRGIDALPPKQQTAIILYYLHGYSLAEAAEIADCNVGTMKSRLHYALKALRVRLPVERRVPVPRCASPRCGGDPMSCRRICRELLWLVRFGDFDAGSPRISSTWPAARAAATRSAWIARWCASCGPRSPSASAMPRRPDRLGGRAGPDGPAGADGAPWLEAAAFLRAGSAMAGASLALVLALNLELAPIGAAPDRRTPGITASAPAGQARASALGGPRAGRGTGPVRGPGTIVWCRPPASSCRRRGDAQAAPPAEADAAPEPATNDRAAVVISGRRATMSARREDTRRAGQPAARPPRQPADLPEYLGVCETSAPFRRISSRITGPRPEL